MPNHEDYFIQQLKCLPDTPESYQANETFIKAAARRVGWSLCVPYPPQWDYWHCVVRGGGVIPFLLEALIEELEKVKGGAEVGQ